jgi:ribonuclease VapC
VIVDASAVVAILRAEPEAPDFAMALQGSTASRISAASWLEAAIVIGTSNPVASRHFDDLVEVARLLIEPVTVEQAVVARAAYDNYGKGSGHPARLNFGDCFSYALARTTGEPLLYQGDDFLHTDITAALPVDDGDDS